MSVCTHDECLSINAKCSDLCYTVFPDDTEIDGYPPYIPGVCGGDYIDFSLCLQCKQIVGFNPEDVQKAMKPQE